MSIPRNHNKSSNHIPPRSSSPSRDQKLLLIKQRINQIASKIKSPLKSSNRSLTADTHKRENRIRIPPKQQYHDSETLEEFLQENGLEKYQNYFEENQLKIQDVPYLTKEDLIDMKLPIGPRNRLLRIIEGMNLESKPETSSRYESSPKRIGLKDEVDKFMQELSQFSKRSEHNPKHSSREQSLDVSLDSEYNSQKMLEGIFGLLKEICDKQHFIMKAVEENQRSVVALKQQFANSKKALSSHSDYR